MDDIKDLDDDEFKTLGVPIGIRGKIKKELAQRVPDPSSFIQNAKTLSRTRTLLKAQQKGKLFEPDERVFVLVANADYSFRRT